MGHHLPGGPVGAHPSRGASEPPEADTLRPPKLSAPEDSLLRQAEPSWELGSGTPAKKPRVTGAKDEKECAPKMS